MPFTKVILLGCGAECRREQEGLEGPVEDSPLLPLYAWSLAQRLAHSRCLLLIVELIESDFALKRVVLLPGSAPRPCYGPSHEVVLRPTSLQAGHVSSERRVHSP